MSAGSRCPYCGKVVAPVEFVFAGVTRTRPGSCSCVGARMEQAAEAREKERSERLKKEAARRVRLRKAGVPERFYEEMDAPEFVDLEKGAWIYGPNGTGKTRAAAACVSAALAEGKKARFSSLREIAGKMTDAFAAGRPAREILMSYANCDLLVLDDLGKEGFTPFQARTLFELVDCRWSRCLPTVVTSNFAPACLVSRLMSVDPSTARAVASRLAALERVELGGEDRRIRGADASAAVESAGEARRRA